MAARPAFALDLHPQVLFALAPALSRAVATEHVTSSVAQAVLALFPTADYISIQVGAAPHQLLLSVHSLMVEGPCRLQLLPADASLAGLAYASRRMVSSSAARGDGALADVGSAWRAWGSTYHTCVPMFVDSSLHILERSLHADGLEHREHSAASVQIVGDYAHLAASAQCIGTLTLGTRDPYALDAGHMANLCLVSCVTALHLSVDAGQLLAAPHVAALLPPAEADNSAPAPSERVDTPTATEDNTKPMSELRRRRLQDGTSCSGAPEESGAPSGGGGAHTQLASCSNAEGTHTPRRRSGESTSTAELTTSSDPTTEYTSCKSSRATSIAEDEDESQGWFGVFKSSALERAYVNWLAATWLQTQRMLLVCTGLPWLVLSCLTEPWRLHHNAPITWAVMAMWLLLQAYVLWRRPDIHRRMYREFIFMAWFFEAWFFPLLAGHIPVATQSPATLRALPWFPFSCGCLTNVVVPMASMVGLRRFVPYQLLSIMAHLPHIKLLCERTGGGMRCYLRAAAWVGTVSLGVAGWLVHWIEVRSRRAFLQSRRRQLEADAAMRAAH